MTDQDSSFGTDDNMAAQWIQTLSDMWLNLAKTMPSHPDAALKTQTAVQNRFTQQLETNLNVMKSFARMMSEPESASAAVNSINALPEMLMKMAQSGYEAAMEVQNHIIHKTGSIGRRTEAYNFDNMDQDVFRALREVYEKEIRQYLKIPPLGLTRFYQERINVLIDKHNLFETTLAEFLSIMYLPMEKSLKVHQERLQQMADEGTLPKEPRENYTLWLKILEGHYMNLFKSDEYLDALHRTLNRLEDFLIAKDDAMRDFLQLLPVVTHKDMDDLHKEFHLLKKRVTQLEKMLDISPNTLKAVT